MDPLPTEPIVHTSGRKSRLWDRIKHRNSSSPTLHKIGVRNLSTRSLPRLGSFGSSHVGAPSMSSPKSPPPFSQTCGPVERESNVSTDSVSRSQSTACDRFSALPNEVKLQIFSYLSHKMIAKASMVCKQWRTLCTDGVLFTTFDTRTFYQNINSPVLLSILVAAGSFLRHLNLRGCVQLGANDVLYLAKRTTNLVSLSLEGCMVVDSSSLASLLSRNPRLQVVDVSGLKAVTDRVAYEVALNCTMLEVLDVGWCSNLSGTGLLDIASSCTKLRRLRLCESNAFSSHNTQEIMLALHDLENLEVLILSGCHSLTDDTLRFYIRGQPVEDQQEEEEIRRLPIRHLNLSRIPSLTDVTLRNLAGATPNLQRLELAGSTSGTAYTNAGFSALLPHIPKLTHLDLEDSPSITDSTLQLLASLPIAKSLIHLQLSYCTEITDIGLVRILQHCTHLRNLEVDNTHAGDGMLMEAPRLVSRRSSSCSRNSSVGIRIVAYDCGAITWVGISEVLAQNLSLCRTYHDPRRNSTNSTFTDDAYTNPAPIVRLKCTFEWQRLVDAHTRRCLRGEYAAAEQIALGFSRWMMEDAEEGAWGGHARRRRRRALGLADQGEEAFVMGVGRRRLRAFSAPQSCLVM